MSFSKRWFLAAVATCLVAAAAVFAYIWHAGLGSPEDNVGAALNDAPLLLRWREGSSQQYAVRTDSSFRMSTARAGAPKSGQSMAVQLEGTLEFRTLEVGPSQVLTGMQLSSVSLRISGESDPATTAALGTPFRVRFLTSGLPVAFEFPAGLAQEHRDVIENLVRTFQVVIRSGQTWSSEEPNVAGVYEAVYVRKDPSHLDKAKRRFIAPAGAPAGSMPEIKSKESIRIDEARDWIAAMSVDESVRSGDPSGIAVDIDNRALIEVRAGAAAHTAAALEAWRFTASAAPKPAGDGPALGAALTSKEAEERMRSDVASLDSARSGRHVWIHRLRDLVRSDGNLPLALLKAMRAQELSDRTRADLYLVLELAGTPPSQAALASVVGGTDWTPMDRKRAIIALGGVGKPTQEAIQTLWTLSQSADAGVGGDALAGTATLALGSLGNSLHKAQDERYPSLRSDLLNGALGGTPARQRVDFVYALGNTGDRTLVPDIAPLLGEGDPAIRSAAAQSLGSLDPDAAADALLARLRTEKVDVVRSSLAEALGGWASPTPAAVASIRTAIIGEREERTRLAMATILGKSLSTYPENRQVLQSLMQTEKSERVRREVAVMLAAGR